MSQSVRLVIFAKLPVAGFAKTRLIPALGTQGAANLAYKMLQHTLTQALATHGATIELCVTPSLQHDAWSNIPLPQGICLTEQGDGDLGEKLARAAQRTLAAGQSMIVIGTDCLELNSTRLQQAIDALQHADTVMIPATDGGYVLLGLKHFHTSIFENMPWSTASVAADTQRAINALSWQLTVLPACHDIDEPADLAWLPLGWHKARYTNEHLLP